MGVKQVFLVSVHHHPQVLEHLSTHLLHSSGGHGELYAGTYTDFLQVRYEQALVSLQLKKSVDAGGRADICRYN